MQNSLEFRPLSFYSPFAIFTGTGSLTTMDTRNFSRIHYGSNTTTFASPDNWNSSDHFSWQKTLFDGVHLAFTSVELGLCVVGFVLNCFVMDTSRHIRRKTAGTKWMTLLAFWDNVTLLGGSLRTGAREIFGIDSWVMTVIGCRLFVFLFWFGVTNAGAHLACLAGDKAFVLAFPGKHYKVQWDQLIPKISMGFTLFYCLIAAPHLYEKENDGISCEMKTGALKVYHTLFTGISTLAHFASILIGSILFVYKMRQRKSKKSEQKSSRAKTEVEKRQPDARTNRKKSAGTNRVNLKTDPEISEQDGQLMLQIPGLSNHYQETILDERGFEKGDKRCITDEKHVVDTQSTNGVNETETTAENNMKFVQANNLHEQIKLKTPSGKSIKLRAEEQNQNADFTDKKGHDNNDNKNDNHDDDNYDQDNRYGQDNQYDDNHDHHNQGDYNQDDGDNDNKVDNQDDKQDENHTDNQDNSQNDDRGDGDDNDVHGEGKQEEKNVESKQNQQIQNDRNLHVKSFPLVENDSVP